MDKICLNKFVIVKIVEKNNYCQDKSLTKRGFSAFVLAIAKIKMVC
jgi:hypothetical protein